MTDPLDERSPYLVEGIRLFRAGEYFLAHETLEEHWAEAPASERPFLQGLIQLATGFHHLTRGGTVGARLPELEAAEASLDVPALVEKALAGVEVRTFPPRP